ncbi:NAD(P)-binding protein [Clathrospora elynae]|uniref:NAD(P)-binding protein n=1 Tax=Clathrospora elynae TaxID=706981 RepID=A0A6A5SN64_9PLEO|nr:NAD(P)-binding protein [Clathrospora elynae]
MAPKIFLTGGTGYIGGSVLHTIATAHPEYDITVLLRKTPEAFKSTYPNIKVIEGDYDGADAIAGAAEMADIVVHNGDSDHKPSLNAIISGLLKRSSPGYLLHLSGTGIVSDWMDEQYLGKLNPKIWSDTYSLQEIKTLPTRALHRNTETILHDTITKHGDKINIAIMCPPDIYGKGKGLAKTHSAFVPMFVKEVKDLGGKVFYHGEGTNARSWVHIDDLMKVYLHVVEAAASNSNAEKYFNGNGYYFAGTQEHSQLDVAKEAGKILHKHGVIKDAEPVQVSLEQLDSMASFPGFEKLARYLFASNSRTRAERAEKLFAYKGEAPGLLENLEADIMDAINRA